MAADVPPVMNSGLPRRLLAWLTDLLWPPRCVGCGRAGAWFCGACVARIDPPVPSGWVCGECGWPLADCGHTDVGPLAAVLAVGAFDGPLRAAIHALKYRRQRALVPVLAGLLVAGLAHTPAPWGTDLPLVLAVPLHSKRVRERGFSQGDLLAAALARQGGYRLGTGLVRVRDTRPQVGLSAAARRANMAGAFAWRGPEPPPVMPLVLVDDVYTTGETMTAAAEALEAAGAGPIYGLTLARPRLV